jgi:Putative Flp pilus-assembly TadE/G-like
MERDLSTPGACDFLSRLLRDHGGNTLALLAAGLIPLLALVGGGIDMGRSYLSQTRLQQACDAGVLAARKKLGSAVVTDGLVPGDVATFGNRFFNINFQDGSYATENREFTMTLEEDYAISGEATIDVPTTVMGLFGYDQMPIEVTCEARLNFSNTDIMFVLDTTGSMAQTNPGDTSPRIDVLRSVVKNFHAQLEGSKPAGSRMRYGFVPYSTNVNVGLLLDPDWMVDEWTYQGRVLHDTGATTTGPVFREDWTEESGERLPGASYVAADCPDDTANWVVVDTWTDPDGTEHTRYRVNGNEYSCSFEDSGSLMVSPTVYTDFVTVFNFKNEGNRTIPVMDWSYQPVTLDVSGLKDISGSGSGAMELGKVDIDNAGGEPMNPMRFEAWFRGCIEERSTYEIDDWDNVDLIRALDLDLDLVPDPADPDTQWRPMLNEMSWVRSIDWRGRGSFSVGAANYRWDYLNSGWAGLSACPAQAQKLREMNAGDVSSYVDSLYADGSTYHDIGMIWGARLLSPTGLFAEENADVDGKPTARHMIFLTDGETAPLDLSYGSYGIEPLDQHRWSPGSGNTLAQVVEARFGVACTEAKKRNITVWVIGFGVGLNPIMTECAGPGRYFEAADAAELQNVFSTIASQLGDLRISK